LLLIRSACDSARGASVPPGSNKDGRLINLEISERLFSTAFAARRDAQSADLTRR
jgi:hypothetical protein